MPHKKLLDNDFAKELEEATTSVLEAGSILKAYFQKPFRVVRKSTHEMVAEVDDLDGFVRWPEIDSARIAVQEPLAGTVERFQHVLDIEAVAGHQRHEAEVDVPCQLDSMVRGVDLFDRNDIVDPAVPGKYLDLRQIGFGP